MQIVWMSDEGDQYRCVDFESSQGEAGECFGQCLNGGVCRNGKCACPEGFSGSNCQFEVEDGGQTSFLQALMDDSVVLIVYALMIAVIAALFVGAWWLY